MIILEEYERFAASNQVEYVRSIGPFKECDDCVSLFLLISVQCIGRAELLLGTSGHKSMD